MGLVKLALLTVGEDIVIQVDGAELARKPRDSEDGDSIDIKRGDKVVARFMSARVVVDVIDAEGWAAELADLIKD